MDLLPVLDNDDCCNGDRYQDRKWGCNIDRQPECKQRDNHKRFAKTKGGSNKSREKEDQQNWQRRVQNKWKMTLQHTTYDGLNSASGSYENPFFDRKESRRRGRVSGSPP